MRNRNYPYYEHPDISSIADMLEQEAERTPDAPAFRYRLKKDRAETRTRLDVLKDAKKAAGRVSRTVGSGKHVAIIGENSYEWLVAFFAVLGSGNVAVPVDKELPAEETAAMIRGADVTAAIVSDTYADLTAGIADLTVIPMKQMTAGEDGGKEEPLVHPATEDLACIFFTSGTSGQSKGVMLTHGNLAAEISQGARMVDMEGGPVFSVLPYHHTFGLVVTVFIPYHLHAPIWICRSLKRLKEELQAGRPRVLPVVPLFVETLHKQIINGIRKKGKERAFRTAVRLSRALLKLGIDLRPRLFREIREQFGGELRMIFCGGAYLDPMYIQAFRDIGVEILNAFGATECSPGIAINRNHYHRDGSVGLMLPGMEARISPEGEVQIRGAIVMKGYYRKPEETAEALRDGWYATGDLGYLDPDGFLFLTGRMKNLIILSNGENISPEELENDFRRDPGVKDAMVYEENQTIVAEICPEEEFAGNEAYFAELKQKINQGRPAYKQVHRIVLRKEDFIRNTSKKIVRYKNVPGAPKAEPPAQ